MNFLLTTAIIILFFGGYFVSDSFAVDYRDSSGYTPSWAIGQGYHSVLLKCTEMVGDYTSDGNWCFEWTAYVLDQGVENFPQSTKSSSSSSSTYNLSERICPDNKICAFPGEFLKYKNSDTYDNFSEIAIVEFKEKINDNTIKVFIDGFGSKPLTYTLDLKTGIEKNSQYNVDRPFNLLEPIPMKIGQKVSQYMKGYFESTITDEKSVNLKELGLMDVKRVVMMAKTDLGGGDSVIRVYDKETGVLITNVEKYHLDGKEYTSGMVLVDTNIFSAPTKLISAKVTSKQDHVESSSSTKTLENIVSNQEPSSKTILKSYKNEFVLVIQNLPDANLYQIPITSPGKFGNPVFIDDLGYRGGAGIGDFDNDGDLDFVAGARQESCPDGKACVVFYLFDSQGNGKFTKKLIENNIPAGPLKDNLPSNLAVADFNGDGLTDFVTGIYRSNYVYLFSNNGDKSFTRTGLSSLADTVSAKEGDFNEDGKMDFAISEYFGSNVYVYKGNGKGGFESKSAFSIPSSRAGFLTVNDFNEDGHADILVDGFSDKTGYLYFGQGNGNFVYDGIVYTRDMRTGVDSFDFDKDGHIDLIVSDYESAGGNVFIKKGNGDGTFQDEVKIASSVTPYAIPVTASKKYETISVAETINSNTLQKSEGKQKALPEWIKNNAGWWGKKQIDDKTFVNGIEFMLKEKIINVSVPTVKAGSSDQKIPTWIRNNAAWWAEGLISEEDFINGIEYLVGNGMIVITNSDTTQNIPVPKENTVQPPIYTSPYDPEIVKSAKANIPGMQSPFRAILKQCNSVNSYSDYEVFVTAIAMMQNELIQNTNDVNAVLTALELAGYDKHPDVGPLIKETRNLALNTSSCIDKVLRIYG